MRRQPVGNALGLSSRALQARGAQPKRAAGRPAARRRMLREFRGAGQRASRRKPVPDLIRDGDRFADKDTRRRVNRERRSDGLRLQLLDLALGRLLGVDRQLPPILCARFLFKES